MSITGLCLDCDTNVELNQFGQCCYCLSESIIKREPKKLGLTKGEELMKELNRK